MKGLGLLCLLCWVFGVGSNPITDEATDMTEAAVSEGTFEESRATESWRFEDYTARDYPEYSGVSLIDSEQSLTTTKQSKTTYEATATTESKSSEGTSEESSTTESWTQTSTLNSDYKSRNFEETLLKNTSLTEDKIQGFRKVAQILTLLGEKIIPTILGDPPVNRCAKKMQRTKENKTTTPHNEN